MKKKLKVVWICHFTNDEIQKTLQPRKRTNEFAPWIPLSYNILKNDPDLELHIISPHTYISGIKALTKEGIRFYFYNAHMPITGRQWPGFFKWDYISNFRRNKLITRLLVNKIQPDIIHLHGAENAYYSSTILQFIGVYPTILTVQGFVSKTSSKNTQLVKKRIAVEAEILRKIKNAFYRTATMAKDINAFNTDINLFWNNYPQKEVRLVEKAQKKFDLVFFARISKDKGIVDLIKALVIIKQSKPNITLCAIGSERTKPFKLLAQEMGVAKNITWAGFLPTQDDVHQMASQAKISVLPTYHEIVSGTILESMLLKLPVVAYNVGSIHEINEKDEIITLVDKLDVEGLASAINHLLEKPDVRKEKAEKGYKRAYDMFAHSDEVIRESLLTAYQQTIEEFYKYSKKYEPCRKSRF